MAKRPMLNLTTTALIERIAVGDDVAQREGFSRLANQPMEHNARMIRRALGLPDDWTAVPAPVAEVAPVPAAAPVAPAAPAPAIPGVSPELVAAVLAALAAQQGTPAPVADVPVVSQPAPNPSADLRAAAARAFSKRVAALATEGNVRFLARRAKQLAESADFTSEDVESLSDQDCMDLVIASVSGIRPPEGD